MLGICQLWHGSAAAQVPVEAAPEFNRALEHFRAGSYAEALQVIEPLSRRHPRAAEVRHLLAIVLDLNRKPEEANQQFRQAVELRPDSVVFRANLGASLMRLGRSSEAETEFRKVLEVEPSNATASFNLGTILLQQGRPEEALPWLERAFKLQPDVYENAYQLAYCQFLMGEYEEVEAVLGRLPRPSAPRVELQFLKALTERALGREDRTDEVLRAMIPRLEGRPQMQFQVALLLLSQDLPEPAEKLLESVVRQLPSSYPARLNLARAQREQEKWVAATRSTETALKLQETSEAHVLLGELLEAREKPLEAVSHFRQAVALDPTPDTYYALGHEFLIHWNWEAAAQVFSTGIERNPDSWQLWIGAGAAALGLTRYDEATRAFLTAVKLRPDALMGFQLLSQAFDEAEGAFDDAVDAFEGLRERQATNPWAVYLESLAAFRKAIRSGDLSPLADRVEVLTRLTQEKPRFLEAHLLRGEIQFEVQEWNGSVEALTRVVQLDPQHVAAHYRLGLALQRLGRSQEARAALQQYQALKAQEDQSVGERVATTTRFIVELKQDDKHRQP